MPQRTQKGRLQELAKQINWNGDIMELHEFLSGFVNSLPPKIAEPVKSYYLDFEVVPRRDDGKYNIHRYQRLLEGRAAFKFVVNMSVEQVKLLLALKEAGRI
jgi:hypothetical protein